MNLGALRIDESMRLVPIEADQAKEAVRDADARIWLDISYPDDADLVNLLKAFDISELAHRRSSPYDETRLPLPSCRPETDDLPSTSQPLDTTPALR